MSCLRFTLLSIIIAVKQLNARSTVEFDPDMTRINSANRSKLGNSVLLVKKAFLQTSSVFNV